MACSFILAGMLPSLSSGHGTHSQLMGVVDRKILEQPQNGNLWYQRAWLNFEHEDSAQALEDLEKAENFLPGKLPTLWLKGEVLALGGKTDEAKRSFDGHIARFPDDGRGYASRARVLAKLGLIDGSLADFRKAMDQTAEPTPDLYQEVAVALAGNGHQAEGIQVLDAGLKRLGKIPSLLEKAIEMEANAGRFDSALSRVEDMRNSAPRPEPWMAKRAILLSQAKRIGESREAWKSLITHLENLPNLERGSNSMSLLAEQAHQALTKLPEHVSETVAVADDASRHTIPVQKGAIHEEELQRANEQITASPDESKLWYQRSLLLLADGQFQQALLDCDEADRLTPDELPTGYVRGQALAGLGEVEKGRAVLDDFVEKFSEHIRARAARARVLIELHQPDLALEDYRRALKISAEKPDIDLLLEAVIAFEANGHRDEAMEALDRGLVTLGDVPSLLLRALEMEATAGKYDAALSRVDALAKTAPKQEPWMAKRAELLARSGRTADARTAWRALIRHLDTLPNLERGQPAMAHLAARAQAALSSPDSIPPTATSTTPIPLR